MTEIKGKYQVSLCRGKSCCPQLIIKDDRYIITDDIGGSVVLEKSNIDELINQYQEYSDLKSLKKWSLGK
jgi:hypothetical protein